jgi:hypothetical protein
VDSRAAGEGGGVTLKPDDRGGWWMVDGKDCQVSLEQRPYYCDRGNFIAKLHPIPGTELARELDHQDGWPRYYFDFDRMLAEVEAWLVKRGQMPS